MLFTKVVGETEKCVFWFYFKAKQTFWPVDYIGVNLTNEVKDLCTENCGRH